jgi:hypothetical protein
MDISDSMLRIPPKSVRQLAQRKGIGLATAHKVFRKILNLFPYKVTKWTGSGMYRRSWTSLPTPFISAQILSERTLLYVQFNCILLYDSIKPIPSALWDPKFIFCSHIPHKSTLSSHLTFSAIRFMFLPSTPRFIKCPLSVMLINRNPVGISLLSLAWHIPRPSRRPWFGIGRGV